MEMILDKKQIQAIFLFRFQMSHTAAETTHNINHAFCSRTANERPMQWWYKKFYKGDESLEDEECSGHPSKVENDQLRGSLKLFFLKPHEKLPKNSTLTILQSVGIWSKSERWKNS